MFARLSSAVIFVFLMFTVFAAATTTVTVTAPATTTTIPAGQCNTGPIQCCNSVTQASSGAAGLVLGLLNIVLSNTNVLVGLTCSPILGGGSCNASPVCCQNNNFSGLIVIGCSPVSLL